MNDAKHILRVITRALPAIVHPIAESITHSSSNDGGWGWAVSLSFSQDEWELLIEPNLTAITKEVREEWPRYIASEYGGQPYSNAAWVEEDDIEHTLTVRQGGGLDI
jgi:hypothetical protein